MGVRLLVEPVQDNRAADHVTAEAHGTVDRETAVAPSQEVEYGLLPDEIFDNRILLQLVQSLGESHGKGEASFP